MCDHPREPWFFRRDELTLIEEGFDDLLHIHERMPNCHEKRMQSVVLKEHMATEEAYEQELADVIGPDWITAISTESLDEEDEGQEEGFESFFPSALDPFEMLYRESLKWSRFLVAWAHTEYFRIQNRDRDIYRVLVNAHLVPIKISFAVTEALNEDELSREIASKELDLAKTYLDRTIGSLKTLNIGGKLPERLQLEMQRGIQIRQEIDRCMKRPPQSRPPHL